MRRFLMVAILALLAAGLSVMSAISVMNREVYGRWGTVVRMEAAPWRYWSGILFLLGMLVMLILAMLKVWKER